MAEDWRLRIDLSGDDEARRLADRLQAAHIEDAAKRGLGGRIVLSRDGQTLFLYADDEAALRSAQSVVEGALAEESLTAEPSLTRWHPEAEEWQPGDLPESPADHAREHHERIEQEDSDTAADGYAEWEARVTLPSHKAARALSQRLDAEGVVHVQRWRYLLVGAADEDAANAWAERLRAEAPRGSKVTVEGTFRSIERHNPFAYISGLGGGP